MSLNDSNPLCSSAKFVEFSRGKRTIRETGVQIRKTDLHHCGLGKPLLLGGGVDEVFCGSYHNFDLPYRSINDDKFSSNDRL